MTTFEFVREQLIAAGRSGISQTDLFIALREADIARRRKGTYSSFHSKFFILVRLGWVERMAKTAPATTKYSNLPNVLSDKTFYRITREGRDALDWTNPLVVNYPQYEDQSRYYIPTGRPRGRPRVERRRRVRVAREILPRVVAPTEAPAEPVRERRRRLRISVSQQIESELLVLRESVSALRTSRDLSQVDVIEKAGLRLFDRALDAQESASGEERERLNRLVSRLESAPEGIDDVRVGLSRRNEVTFQRGIESLLGFFSG